MIQDHSDHDASKEPMNPSVPLMHHDPNDLESFHLIRIIQKERTLKVTNSVSLKIKKEIFDKMAINEENTYQFFRRNYNKRLYLGLIIRLTNNK